MTIHRPDRDARGPFTRSLLTAAVTALALAGCAADVPDAVIEEPTLIQDASPFRYPVALWDAGVEGETVLMVRVTEAGAVDTAYVLDPSGQAAFDSAAVTGARDLRFTPGRRDDHEAAMWAKVPVRFYLGEANGVQAGTAARPDGAEPSGDAP